MELSCWSGDSDSAHLEADERFSTRVHRRVVICPSRSPTASAYPAETAGQTVVRTVAPETQSCNAHETASAPLSECSSTLPPNTHSTSDGSRPGPVSGRLYNHPSLAPSRHVLSHRPFSTYNRVRLIASHSIALSPPAFSPARTAPQCSTPSASSFADATAPDSDGFSLLCVSVSRSSGPLLHFLTSGRILSPFSVRTSISFVFAIFKTTSNTLIPSIATKNFLNPLCFCNHTKRFDSTHLFDVNQFQSHWFCNHTVPISPSLVFTVSLHRGRVFVFATSANTRDFFCATPLSSPRSRRRSLDFSLAIGAAILAPSLFGRIPLNRLFVVDGIGYTGRTARRRRGTSSVSSWGFTSP